MNKKSAVPGFLGRGGRGEQVDMRDFGGKEIIIPHVPGMRILDVMLVSKPIQRTTQRVNPCENWALLNNSGPTLGHRL